MSAVTDRFDLPYPESTDPPAGAPQIRALAEAVDQILVRSFRSLVTAGQASSVPSGGTLPGTPATVDFTAAGFTAPPVVIAVTQGAPSGIAFVAVRVASVTATSAQVIAYNASNQSLNTGGSIPIAVIAFQP